MYQCSMPKSQCTLRADLTEANPGPHSGNLKRLAKKRGPGEFERCNSLYVYAFSAQDLISDPSKE